MRYITATRIFSGNEFLPNNTILVLNDQGVITDLIKPETAENSAIEHYEGILCPGFINAHCHLELSHLKGVLKKHNGIVDFGMGVMKHRNELSDELQEETMKQADREMELQGIVAVGDISNTINSLKTKQQSHLYYHTFVELIALNPERANLVFDNGTELLGEFEKNGQSASLAPHAPYSASLELIKKISDDCYSRKQPTTIHNQESKTENEFFQTKSGDYLKLYETINIPIDYFEASGKSSLQTYIPSLKTEVKTQLVHNTFTSKSDFEIIRTKNFELYWCLCPNANLYIENCLPDIALMIAEGCTLTIGTDSLASNSQLSIIEEINTILKLQPEISIEALLKAATINGARFLGIENQFGTLDKNKKSGINLIQGIPGNYSVKKLA
ncbi:MAG: amidohydrolase family protein [Bacteroidota bacterium]